MRLYSQTNTLKELCRMAGKWGMFVNFPQWDWFGDLFKDSYREFHNQLFQAAPWLKEIEERDDKLTDNFEDKENPLQAISDGQAFLLFDSEEECEKYYNLTVGDDGPTELNSYNGKVRVYALTCDDKGQLRNENT